MHNDADSTRVREVNVFTQTQAIYAVEIFFLLKSPPLDDSAIAERHLRLVHMHEHKSIENIREGEVGKKEAKEELCASFKNIHKT